MKGKTALILIFSLIFSAIFNINSNIVAKADIFNIARNYDGPELKNSNIKNGERYVSPYKTFTLTFDKNIKLGSGNIELFNRSSFKREKVKTTVSGNVLTIKPVDEMEYSSRYWLTLEEDSITDIFGNYIEEISYYFTIERRSGSRDDNKDDDKITTYGFEFGEVEGELRGYIDFLNGRRNNWSGAILSNRRIINEYNLDEETSQYRNTFLYDFEEGFKKGYEEAFRSENFDIILNSYEEGRSQGELLGTLLGEIDGKRDFYNNKSNDWERWLLSDSTIIRDYNLAKDNSAYLESFIKSFKNSYKESYTTSFRLANVENSLVAKENGLNHGTTIGTLAGENQGRLDYVNGRDNNWEFNLSSDRIIIEKYNLDRNSVEYREGFLIGYKDSYREGYISSFQDINLEIAEGNLNVSYISMQGGEVSSYDRAIKLKIEPGSFYEETGISIERDNLSNRFLSTAMTPATDSYIVKVQNLTNSVNLKKPIKIEFEYYGSEEGSIYEYKNGKWLYLYSTIKDNKIFTNISTSHYSGGMYAVLINENYEALDDTKGHWAEKAIETFLKRNYINGYPDKTFRPEQSITRAEFINVLNNVYNWSQRLPSISVSSSFRDSNIFGSYSNSIYRAVQLGYISGYSDNTFRPHISINYEEVEWIVQRLTNRFNFKWNIVAEKILKDHYVRSKSYNNKKNYITRAEVVYMLYLLEEGFI